MPTLVLNSTWNFPGSSSLRFTERVAPPAFYRVDLASRICLLSSFSCARFSFGSTEGSKYFALDAESFHAGSGLVFAPTDDLALCCRCFGFYLFMWLTPFPMPDFCLALVDLFLPPEFFLSAFPLVFETVIGSGCSDLNKPVSSTSILKASCSA